MAKYFIDSICTGHDVSQFVRNRQWECEKSHQKREKKCTNEVQIKEIKIHAEKKLEYFFPLQAYKSMWRMESEWFHPRWLVFTILINSEVQSDYVLSFTNRRRRMIQNSAVQLKKSHRVTTPEELCMLYADSHIPWGTLQHWQWWGKQSKKYN